jgi:sporulation protein YlmC with PRC-barrel domain
MFLKDQINRVKDSDVYGENGEKIGSVGEVYLDDETGQPQWFTIKTGLFGMNESVVPTDRVTILEDRITVPFTKDQVKDAPNFDPSDNLTSAQERQIYDHYGRGSDYEAWSHQGISDVGTSSSAGLGTRTSTSGVTSSSGPSGTVQRTTDQLRLRRAYLTNRTGSNR